MPPCFLQKAQYITFEEDTCSCRSACHVVYTDFRPTPLQHYVFPANGDGLYLVVDEKSTFKEDTFQKAVAALNEGSEQAAAKRQQLKEKKGAKQGSAEEDSDIFKIVKMIMERQYDPVRPPFMKSYAL